jgi:hypothetical protein
VHSILATFKVSANKGMQMKGYEGGNNPLLIFILIGISVLLGAALILYILWELYKKIKFVRVCGDIELTGEEIGVFKSFIRRFKTEEPLLLVMKRNYLDAFSNQVAHHFGNREIGEEDLDYEIKIFNSIREKTGFAHLFKAKKIASSRALPVGTPLLIKYHDKNTKNDLEFASIVLDNNDLFLGIMPPKDDDLTWQLRDTRKPFLDISFIRQRDAEYHFDTHILKFIRSPQDTFFLQHSKSILRGMTHSPVKLPASIIYHTDEGADEYECLIELLDCNTCSFILEDQTTCFKKSDSALLSATIKDTPLALQITITKLIKRGKTLIHRADLKNLSEDTTRLIMQFAYDHSSKKNKGK